MILKKEESRFIWAAFFIDVQRDLLGMDMISKVSHSIFARQNLLRFSIRNLDREFIFERHDELNCI